MPAAEPPLDPDLPDSQWVSLRWMAASRLVIAAALTLLLFIEAPVVGPGWFADATLFARAVLCYLAASFLFLATLGWMRPRFHAQLVVHVATDLIALTVLLHAAGGLRAGFGVLVVAAVTSAAVLSTRLMAASFAAAASLLLLGEAVFGWLRGGGADTSPLMAAGLTGAACFVTALLVNWLARQLKRQETIARRRGADLRNQFAVTRQVVAELDQGVLVLSPDDRIKAVNRAAKSLLGIDLEVGDGTLSVERGVDLPALARGLPAVDALLGARDAWLEAGGRSDERCDLLLPGSAPLGVSVRFVATPGGDTLLMIEDLRKAQAQAQQLKLASMGRLSASIAHEIRNPLGAIRHANALLGEQLEQPAQRRLSRIIEDNTVRIDRVVADVLSVARRDSPNDESIDIAGFMPAFLDEFAMQAGVPRSRIGLSIESDRRLRFDPNHLQRVLVNLVGNALRYATQADAAVQVGWRDCGNDRLELRISDDGPGLPQEMLQHAFEPFFTTETRGTGLGLFLSRELCVANRASIRYEAPGAGRRGAFVIEVPADARA